MFYHNLEVLAVSVVDKNGDIGDTAIGVDVRAGSQNLAHTRFWSIFKQNKLEESEIFIAKWFLISKVILKYSFWAQRLDLRSQITICMAERDFSPTRDFKTKTIKSLNSRTSSGSQKPLGHLRAAYNYTFILFSTANASIGGFTIEWYYVSRLHHFLEPRRPVVPFDGLAKCVCLRLFLRQGSRLDWLDLPVATESYDLPSS